MRGVCVGRLALSLAALARRGAADVLLVRVQGEDGVAAEHEAAAANWNQGLEDQSPGPFAGPLHFEASNPGGCDQFEPDSLRGRVLLIDSAATCSELAPTVATAAISGASGVVFFHREESGLGGMALGDRAPPPIRAVMVERRHGEALREHLLAGTAMHVELVAGRLISEDAYEEHFIFRADELESTRALNFLWHRRPEMLASEQRTPLSMQLMQRNVSVPEGWFSNASLLVPLFNPSLVALEDGSFLVVLRMSNGPGCPSVRRSKQSSMDTRIFRNALVLAHVDSQQLAVLDHTNVETPPLSCHFTKNTKVSGRQFLDEVHGAMDARIYTGSDGELWLSFYAERNLAGGQEVFRGMHAAPLHVSWRACAERGAEDWQLRGQDAVFTWPGCEWLQRGDGGSLEACRASCDGVEQCNAVTYRAGRCELRLCGHDAGLSALAGWQAWLRREPPAQWHPGRHSCGWLGTGRGDSPDACRASCEAASGCDGVLYSPHLRSCSLRSCLADGGAGGGAPPPGWEAWHRRGAPGRHCLGRAWLEASEVVTFPAESGVEKNWNLIRVEKERLLVEYHIEPHIVLEATLSRARGPSGAPNGGPLELAALGTAAVSRWPYDVLHGITNVRGGYCCMQLPEGPEAQTFLGLRSRPLLLGCGHLQRIRTPFDQARGDVGRFRRQAKSRTYHQFFYLLRGEPPFDVVAVSTEWCVTANGHFSRRWRDVLADGEEACESIQFAAGLAMRGSSEVVVSYGINDCEADLLPIPLWRVLSMLRPVRSEVNISLEELEMI